MLTFLITAALTLPLPTVDDDKAPVRVQIQPDEAPEIRFRWELGTGAESCPGEDALRDAVAARLGYFPFTKGADRSLVASVTR